MSSSSEHPQTESQLHCSTPPAEISRSLLNLSNWLLRKKKQISYAILFFFLGASVWVYWQGGRKREAQESFFSASYDLQNLQGHYSEQTLAHLQELVKKEPKLQVRCNGLLIQSLLAGKRLKEVAHHLDSAMQGQKEMQGSVFHQFGNISIAVEQKDFEGALQRSLLLKETLQDLSHTYAALYFSNLIRIALLQQELKEKIAESQAWQEVENFMAALQKEIGGKVSPFSELLTTYQSKDLALVDYIEDRKQTN